MSAKKRLINKLLSVVLTAVFVFSGCGSEVEINWIDDNYRNYYEIFVGSFYDTDGDGTGDINGVTQKLDYIKELGCNGIWLTPVMPSPTYHKYDVTDYKSIDPSFGTFEDFAELVGRAHEKGINIILDLVLNHTSSKHPWFVEACEYLKGYEGELSEAQNKYVSYYNFVSDGDTKIGSGKYYRIPGNGRWYYEGDFWSEMPDLNLENEDLMAELYDIADFWIDKGIDGFRMDAVAHYTNNSERDAGIIKRFYEHCREKKSDFYMVGEAWDAQSVIETFYSSMAPSMFNFPASSAEGVIEMAAKGTVKGSKLADSIVDYQNDYSAINPDFINAWFLTNHDQVRAANNLNADIDTIKFAGGILTMMPGAIYIYYGEELAMKSKGNEDVNKRLPFVWSSYPKSEGMCKKLMEAADVEQSFGSLEEQKSDAGSVYNYYKAALRLRNENPEIARGSVKTIDALNSGTIGAVSHIWRDKEAVVLYNTSKESVSVDLTGSGYENMTVVGSLTIDNSKIKKDGNRIDMKERSICVLR